MTGENHDLLLEGVCSSWRNVEEVHVRDLPCLNGLRTIGLHQHGLLYTPQNVRAAKSHKKTRCVRQNRLSHNRWLRRYHGQHSCHQIDKFRIRLSARRPTILRLQVHRLPRQPTCLVSSPKRLSLTKITPTSIVWAQWIYKNWWKKRQLTGYAKGFELSDFFP
jgi:hypothetical protein